MRKDRFVKMFSVLICLVLMPTAALGFAPTGQVVETTGDPDPLEAMAPASQNGSTVSISPDGCLNIVFSSRDEEPRCETSVGSAGSEDLVQPSSDGPSVTATMDIMETIRSGPYQLDRLSVEGEERFLRLHHEGAVAVMTPNGESLWERQQLSLREDWDLTVREYPPRILMGPAKDWLRAPDSGTTEKAHAILDLTGDGNDDVLVAHNAIFDRPHVHGAVSLLRGSDGTTLWSETTLGVVRGIAMVDGTLVVAEENGDPSLSSMGREYGEEGGRSSLRGITFSVEDGDVTATEAWRWEYPDAVWGRWSGPIAVGDGLVAVAYAWNSIAVPVIAVVDTTTGHIVWSKDLLGPIGLMAYDGSTGELVYTETLTDAENDFGNTPNQINEFIPEDVPVYFDEEGWFPEENGFMVRSVRASDGADQTLSVPTLIGQAHSLVLGDLTGNGVNDWVVTHEPRAPHIGQLGTLQGPPMQNMITVLDGSTGLHLWQRTIGSFGGFDEASAVDSVAPPTPINPTTASGVLIEGGNVFVGSALSDGLVDLWQMWAFDGLVGQTLWAHEGHHAASPQSLFIGEVNGERSLLGVNPWGTYMAYDLDDGSVRLLAGFLSEVNAATTAQVNEEGPLAVVLGAKSGGIFAVDSSAFDMNDPVVLWQTLLKGPIRELHRADVTGSGVDSVIAVAGDEVAVIDPTTGETIVSIPFDDDLAWTLTLHDVSGDGVLDLIIPTQRIEAFRGSDGAMLWHYSPGVPVGTNPYFSTVSVVKDRVVSQYTAKVPIDDVYQTVLSASPLIGANPAVLGSGLVGLDLATGTEVWSETIPIGEGKASLWRSTAPGPEWPGAEGYAVSIIQELPGIDGWKGLRVIDARTGEDLMSERPSFESYIVGVHALHTGDVVVQAQNSRVQRVGPEGLAVGPVAYYHVTSGHFGPLGDGVVATGLFNPIIHSIDIFDTGFFGAMLSTPRSPFRMGTSLSVDLNGDGVDSVISFAADFETMNTMLGHTGGFIYSFGIPPQGVSVLHLEIS